jgi:lipopolysaccharide/colanic/teichoic acid biosynthesis glycosyltransferase
LITQPSENDVMFQNLLARLENLVAAPWSRQTHAVLLQIEQFQRELDCERVRTERSGRTFSVVVLTLAEKDLQNGGLSRLASILERRLRITDSAGHLTDGRIGVLLPDTAADGAWTVADDVRGRYATDGYTLTCEVCTYPEDTRQRNGTRHANNRREAIVAGKTQLFESLYVKPLPMWKRLLDVSVALVALVLVSPVLLLAAFAVRLSSPGPIIFRQWRSGRGGRPFLMYKFRTMVCGAEALKQQLMALNEQDGPAFKIERDPRVTSVGRFLRCTSIDELPQLLNILKGDMSLVGPRPLPCDESDACLPWQRQRLQVTPGLTCIWQVSGRSQVSFAEWVRMDLRYIRTCTLGHDLKLLAQTIPAVILRRGAK